MKTFNFFDILGKDNKELVHSAFLSYLVCEDAGFRAYLGLPEVELHKPRLECARSAAKTSRAKNSKVRIDVEIQSIDGNHVILIENKFKSAPIQKQLDDYDWIYKKLSKDEKTFKKKATFHKLLFCFDKKLAGIISDTWKVWDYTDVLAYLEKRIMSLRPCDEQIFNKHYSAYLRGYAEMYELYKYDSRTLLEKGHFDKEDKFWLRMLNANLHIKCLEHFGNRKFVYYVNPGNSSVPYLSIVPGEWQRKTGLELLIQVQGKELKCYIHSRDRTSISRLIEIAQESFEVFSIKPKKLGAKETGTCYIFKIIIKDSFLDSSKVGLNEVFDLIKSWYVRIDQDLVDKFTKVKVPVEELVS